jgi:hypothetical protein
MTKEDFLLQYILTRTSHKRTLEQLTDEALQAWAFVQNNKD